MSRDAPKSNLEQQIEENLRKVYQKTAQEQVPDKLAKLLEQLKAQEQSK